MHRGSLNQNFKWLDRVDVSPFAVNCLWGDSMATRLKFNEGKSCDAVIQILETREGSVRSSLGSPEHERHYAPVELTCKIGEKLFAIEHTGIEPFAGHMQLDAEAQMHIKPIEAFVAGKLPPNETFELNMPALATQGLRLKEVRNIQEALAAWIVAAAPNLPIARYGDYLPEIRKTKPPGVPFDVSLYRFETIITPSRFFISHLVSDHESAREKRIREACARKFPKLAAWRQNGARSVLILEDNDIFLTNAQVVYEALAKVEGDFSDRPDEIYLVSSVIEDKWFVHVLRADDVGYYEMTANHECLYAFDPAQLVDLTQR
jgi:hypothetical protein